MARRSASRGSALLIALVIVIITAGIGGAFLAQALVHSNEQKWSIEADEAITMCDAGMERARQAMGAYRGNKTWTWKDMITYCAGPGRPTTGPAIKADAMALFKSAAFSNYLGTIYASGPSSAIAANSTDPTSILPMSTTAWSSVDTYPPSLKNSSQFPVPIGNSIPFQRGAIFIQVAAPPGTPAGVDPDNAVVTVTATLQDGTQRQVQGVLSKPSTVVPLKVNGLGAVVSNDVVDLTGSITIDGRDHQYDGVTAITGPAPLGNPPYGAFGIVSNSAMSDPKNGAVGGNGTAPPSPKGAAPNSIASSYNFGANGYPTTPDGVVSQADGTPVRNGALKSAAQAAGTYFSNAGAYSSWLSAQPSPMPGGQVLYLEFSPGNGMFNLGGGNVKSNIMVIHTDTMNGIAQEVHGNFTGLLIADGFVRNNGNAQITGMVQLLSPTASTAGNVFGNGNAEVDFSSAALADLPGTAGSSVPPTPATLGSYRRIQ